MNDCSDWFDADDGLSLHHLLVILLFVRIRVDDVWLCMSVQWRYDIDWETKEKLKIKRWIRNLKIFEWDRFVCSQLESVMNSSYEKKILFPWKRMEKGEIESSDYILFDDYNWI